MTRRIALLLFVLSVSVFSYAQQGRPLEQGWTDKNNTERYAAYMLQIAYNDQGYWGVKVEIRQVGTKRIFTVEPGPVGPVYHIQEVKVSGLKTFPLADVMADAPKPGDVFSPDRINEWIAATRKKYVGETGPLKDVSWRGMGFDRARATETIEVIFQEQSPSDSPR